MIVRLQLPDALKQTVIFGASIALMKGISLLMLPFIANHLSTEDYGRLEVVSTLAIIGSILVGMGLENTLFRFAGVIQNIEQRKRMAAEIFSLTLVMCGIALFAGWLAAGPISGWIPGRPTEYEVRLVLSMLALEGCIAIPLGWLRMSNRAYSFFFAATGRALLHAIIVVIQLSLDRGVEGILEAGLIAALTQVAILSYLHIRDTGLHFNRQTAMRSFTYSLPIVGSGLAAFALNGLDRWILADQASLSDVAQFGVAVKLSLAVVLLMQPYGMWWAPRRFQILTQPNGHKKAAHFIALGLSAVLIIAVLVGLVSPLLINWLLPESYAIAGQYVVGLVIIMALREMTELINIGCFNGKTTGCQFIINIIASITGVLLMLWWTPLYGVWGIIFALMSAQLVRLLLFFSASQYYLPLPYPATSILMLAGIASTWMLLGMQTSTLMQQLLVIVAGPACLLVVSFMLKLIPVPSKILSS
jgi:O-antigen/teichoic acid export membrane protein